LSVKAGLPGISSVRLPPRSTTVHHEAALGVLELSEVGIEGRGARGAAAAAGPEARSQAVFEHATGLAFRLWSRLHDADANVAGVT